MIDVKKLAERAMKVHAKKEAEKRRVRDILKGINEGVEKYIVHQCGYILVHGTLENEEKIFEQVRARIGYITFKDNKVVIEPYYKFERKRKFFINTFKKDIERRANIAADSGSLSFFYSMTPDQMQEAGVNWYDIILMVRSVGLKCEYGDQYVTVYLQSFDDEDYI